MQFGEKLSIPAQANSTGRTGFDSSLTFLLALLIGILSGCAPQILPETPPPGERAPAEFPAAYYQQAQQTGSEVLSVNSSRSLVTIIVRRDGALARLGHDHVVSGHPAQGFVDITGERADLYFTLDQLVVDAPALRVSAGLTTQPSEEAIIGTRKNMLDKVLESRRYPHVLIQARRNPVNHQTLSVSITMHGSTRIFEIPAHSQALAQGLEINGNMSFYQSDFGITPFSILGGAIRVHDRLDLSFRIVAGEHSVQ